MRRISRCSSHRRRPKSTRRRRCWRSIRSNGRAPGSCRDCRRTRSASGSAGGGFACDGGHISGRSCAAWQIEGCPADRRDPSARYPDRSALPIVDTHNGIVPGHVSRIDPAVLNGTRTVDVVLDGPLPAGAVKGLSVDGTIDLEKLNNVLYVGRPALGNENSTLSLFKEDPDHKGAERVP